MKKLIVILAIMALTQQNADAGIIKKIKKTFSGLHWAHYYQSNNAGTYGNPGTAYYAPGYSSYANMYRSTIVPFQQPIASPIQSTPLIYNGSYQGTFLSTPGSYQVVGAP